MASQVHPSWLPALLADARLSPKLFAWSPANIRPTTTSKLRETISNGHHHEDRVHDASNDSDKRIFIVGPGNIGRLFASHLVRRPNPLPITLVVPRKELLSQWVESEGIGLVDPDHGKVLTSKRFNIEWWTETRPQYGPVREVADGEKLRNVFIATKAAAALTEADRLRRYLGRSTSVVFAQNGICKLWPPHGPLYVASRYGTENAPTFSACVVNHGVSSAGPFMSIQSVSGDASIGPVFSASDKRPSDDFFNKYIASTPFLETKQVSSGELWLMQLEKLVKNAAVNPLTALLRCKSGELFTSPDSQDPLTRVLDKLLWEISAVIQGLINHDASLDIVSSYAEQTHQDETGCEDFHQSVAKIRMKLTERFSQPVLKSKLYAFGRKITEHRSSMLQDAEAGKQTEIRDFNGWVVDMADFLGTGLDVSIHQGLIKLIEQGQILDKEELARKLL
ncbi:ketoisovalerate reductase [Fusarium oxysporum]|nr:ketoisovalerate reductase [Fusarium oxysporum]